MSLSFDAGPTLSEGDMSSSVSIPSTKDVTLREIGGADDGELMRLIGLGDRAAFSVFCRRHAGRCLSIAQHLLRNEADAEEAV